MGKFVDISGNKYNNLTVLGRLLVNKWGKPAWVCVCDCGNFKVTIAHHLQSNHTQSCGCIRLAQKEVSESGVVVKKCTQCNKKKPVIDFYVDNNKSLGIQSKCKTCVYKNHIKFKNKNLKQYNKIHCEHAKKYNNSLNGKIVKRRWINKNADKLRVKEKLRWSTDKVLMGEVNKKYHKDNKLSIAKRHKNYPKKVRTDHERLKYNARTRQLYIKSDKAIRLERTVQRRTAKLQAIPPWYNKKEILAIYKLADKIRRWGVDVHVDHIIPLQGRNVSGLHCVDNLQIISATANLKKGNRFNVA